MRFGSVKLHKGNDPDELSTLQNYRLHLVRFEILMFRISFESEFDCGSDQSREKNKKNINRIFSLMKFSNKSEIRANQEANASPQHQRTRIKFFIYQSMTYRY